MSDTRLKILDAAERMVRSGGYNGFSFREIANEVGIKSASVHHHFPTKEALTLELAKQYRDGFFSALGDAMPSGGEAKSQLDLYCQVFRTAFESSGRACLCGVLSNEAEQLPESVRAVVREFVEANICWIETVLGQEAGLERPRESAEMIYSALEGAMGVAALKSDGDWLDRVARSVRLAIFD